VAGVSEAFVCSGRFQFELAQVTAAFSPAVSAGLSGVGGVWRRWGVRFMAPAIMTRWPTGFPACCTGLAERRWHWIHTDFQRVNTRACGIEWLSAPLIAFAKTDRLLFLINIASFLLLPGLVLSLFRQVGVKARTAWHWMWILPGGYCFVLQAGSVSNDMFQHGVQPGGGGFCPSRPKIRPDFAGLPLDSFGGAADWREGPATLPLLLPWAVALLPTWRIWLRHPVGFGGCLLPAIGACPIADGR